MWVASVAHTTGLSHEIFSINPGNGRYYELHIPCTFMNALPWQPKLYIVAMTAIFFPQYQLTLNRLLAKFEENSIEASLSYNSSK